MSGARKPFDDRRRVDNNINCHLICAGKKRGRFYNRYLLPAIHRDNQLYQARGEL